MTTIFKIIGGGQKVRSNVQVGRKTYYEKAEGSDWVENTKAQGSNPYADTMWSTDLDTLNEWANKWAGEEIELFEDQEAEEENQREVEMRAGAIKDYIRANGDILSIKAVENRAGLAQNTLRNFLNGQRGLPEHHLAPIENVLRNFGFGN